MHKYIKIDGQEYALQITVRKVINDGRTEVLMDDAETEALFRENRLVALDHEEYHLIADALNCLSEAREEEIKWACGDKDIVEPDQDCIDSIEALLEKLRAI